MSDGMNESIADKEIDDRLKELGQTGDCPICEDDKVTVFSGTYIANLMPKPSINFDLNAVDSIKVEYDGDSFEVSPKKAYEVLKLLFNGAGGLTDTTKRTDWQKRMDDCKL